MESPVTKASLSALLLGILLPIVVDAASSPFVGTFKDSTIVVTLAAPEEGRYKGTINIGADTFDFAAHEVAPDAGGDQAASAITGTFSAGGTQYPFTAKLKGDTLRFTTGETTYELSRQKGAAPPPSARQGTISSERIEAAIQRAKAYLLSRQKNGSWDVPARMPEPKPNAMGQVNVIDIQNSSQWGGVTALATYALLAEGESPSDPTIAAAIEFLKRADLNGTYSLAMRAQVWNSMPKDKRKDFIQLAQKDRDLLMKNKRTADPHKGLFRYSPVGLGDQGYDSSASQFAVLGIWGCDQVGAEVPLAFWKETEEGWLKTQHGTGGWTYTLGTPQPEPVTPSMTAAGIATLFITQDMLHNDVSSDCKGNISHEPIARAIQWIADHFDTAFGNSWPYYTLYGLERIGLASGYKYLGKNDWYQFGAEKLVLSQQPDGAWGQSITDTCFGLLFLVRGRNPIFINKLEYQIDLNGDKPRDTNWNQRPRDCANLTRWYAKQVEHELRWQIVNLSGPPEDLLDAPMLYISGNQRVGVTPADESKLRQYVEQGGLIVGHADCANQGFAGAYEKLGNKLFPAYEFKELPADHILFHTYFDGKKWKSPQRLRALTNGARVLMVLLPSGDPSRFWQAATYFGHESSYELLANIYIYATERDNPKVKSEPWVAYANPSVNVTSTLKLARVEYDGNWDPEPAGWRRMAVILHNEAKIDLSVESVKLGEGKLNTGGYKVAHICGTAAFRLSESARAELKAFLSAGGTLIADAAGGDFAAATSLETEIELAAGKPKLLPLGSPAYANLGMSASDVQFRRYAAKVVGASKGARLKIAEAGGRAAVYFSAEDLTVGMVGQPVDGVIGYTPASATAIVKSILISIAKP